MEELLKTMTVSDIFIGGFILGMIFNMINDVILSLIDYLREKAWRVSDYEKAFYQLKKLNPYNLVEPCHKIPNFKYVLLGAINNYEKRLEKRERLDKFLSKFRKKKDE